MDIVMIGFGGVGRALAELLRDGRLPGARLVGVATRTHGTLRAPDGLDIDALLRADSFAAYPGAAERGDDILRLIETTRADVLVEVSHTNFQTGQPATDYCRAALHAGMHIASANKGPFALAYNTLKALADERRLLVRCESAVMAGTPSLRLGMQALAQSGVREARGIINGSTNYILTLMHNGVRYVDAVADAKAKGYLEADPSADVDGWDAGFKALILSALLFGVQRTLDDASITGISGLNEADIQAAEAAGERWKLIAHVTPEAVRVAPMRLALAHPLASVGGVTNAITYTTDLAGDITLIGSGAGYVTTAFGVLSDLIEIWHTMVLSGSTGVQASA